jgi:hypothetical protein
MRVAATRATLGMLDRRNLVAVVSAGYLVRSGQEFPYAWADLGAVELDVGEECLMG